MISLSNNTILTRSEDGSKKIFESEELRGKLVSCCHNAGMKDYWLAEDLSNAVETVLSLEFQKGVIFSEAEINAYVVSILQNTGFNNIAAIFKKGCKSITEELSLKELIKHNISIDDSNAETICKKVILSLKKLGINDSPPSLALELAKYHSLSNSNSKIENLDVGNIADSPFIMTRKSIEEIMPKEICDLIDSDIIKVESISRLFPSIKIKVSLSEIANCYKLIPILTEMLFYPFLDKISDKVNTVIELILNELHNKDFTGKKSEYPIYLNFISIGSFIEEYFGVKLPEGGKLCKEVGNYFAENLKYKVIIKFL